jgi:pimeloyl-ACP methyl ester carboxylesterase
VPACLVSCGVPMPATRYALSGDVHVAYQVMGQGSSDLVYVPGWVSHLELEMENVLSRRFYEALASFATVIRFDNRGTGMSDRVMGTLSLEERMDDIRAVLDAAEVERASLFGFSEGGTMAAIFAARYPERLDKLVLFASHAGKVTGSPDFPCGYEAEPRIRWLEDIIERRWGAGDSLEHLAPSLWRHRQADRALAAQARFERMAATPGAALALFRSNLGNDARSGRHDAPRRGPSPTGRCHRGPAEARSAPPSCVSPSVLHTVWPTRRSPRRSICRDTPSNRT